MFFIYLLVYLLIYLFVYFHYNSLAIFGRKKEKLDSTFFVLFEFRLFSEMRILIQYLFSLSLSISLSHAHTHIHAHTHTYTRTHTHFLTITHTVFLSLSYFLSLHLSLWRTPTHLSVLPNLIWCDTLPYNQKTC